MRRLSLAERWETWDRFEAGESLRTGGIAEIVLAVLGVFMAAQGLQKLRQL